MPPISIIIVCVWLSLALFGRCAQFYAEFMDSSRNAGQIAWLILVSLLGLTNFISIIGLWKFSSWSARVFFASSLSLLFFGVVLYATAYGVNAKSGALIGKFSGDCIAFMLIYIIGYLPYRNKIQSEQSISANPLHATRSGDR
jgi:hypothetical protein